MELPVGGRVVIIDDNRKEIEPLMEILSKRKIPYLYYEGTDEKKLPSEPLKGIRIVFLDLFIGPSARSTDEVLSNDCSIMSKLLDKENGPFLLIVWSTTGNEHIDELKQKLNIVNIFPEAVLSLSKTDFFEADYEAISSRMAAISSVVDSIDIDSGEKNNLLEEIKKTAFTNEKVLVKDGFEKLEKAIDAKVAKAGILPFFIVWENAIAEATVDQVSALYSADPGKPEKRLISMVNTLAKNVLEQRYSDAPPTERLQAACVGLNELFAYFFEKRTYRLYERLGDYHSEETSEDDIIIDEICEELHDTTPNNSSDYISKLNTWKIIRDNSEKELHGNVHKDERKRFNWMSLANQKKDINSVKDKMSRICETQDNFEYVYMNINGECEEAQKKDKFIKIVPGIMIEEKAFKSEFKANDVKHDSILLLGPFEYNNKNNYLVFGLDQCSYIIEKNEEDKEADTPEGSEELSEVLFTINRSYYLSVRQKIAANYNKAGTSLFM